MDNNKQSAVVNDELLKNGLQLTNEFEVKINKLVSEGADFVLAVIDLDNFAAINKQYGFGEGDNLLIAVGKHIKAIIGEAGSCYRTGGDEFAVIFAEGIEKEEAFLKLEGMRSAFNYEFPDKEAATISVGIAANNDDATTVSELIRKAEGAMIRAKLSGRNRVSLARDDKMVTKTTHYTAEQLHRLTKVSKREGIGEAILLREALDALLKKYDA